MHALDLVYMGEQTAPSGMLVRVLKEPDSSLPIDEQIALRTAFFLDPQPTHILFRRFSDGRSSQIAAYVVDNSICGYTREQVSKLHHNVWLSGITPLLYVGDWQEVTLYACAAAAQYDKQKNWKSTPIETLLVARGIENELLRGQRYAAFSLIDGTFWDDPRNAEVVDSNKSAHKVLIAKVCAADKELDGARNPVARHLLLLTLLLKYLEDRKVIPNGWFDKFLPGATSCIRVFECGGRSASLAMLKELERKFNGDIFKLDEISIAQVTDAILKKLAMAVQANVDVNGQLYLWDIFSFKYIPVEVLSHIYQQFAERDQGAIFTPPSVVNLLLDFAMPMSSLQGTETVLDPACGSGIFLVSAFRRLIQARLARTNWQLRLSPTDLKQLLAQTIFGIELQQTAAELAAFSLALAVCDALQPEIIWNELQFNKLLNDNICVGDFSELVVQVKKNTKNEEGFDFVLGNPPFMSKLTASMKKYAGDKSYSFPDNQASYFFLFTSLNDALSEDGTLCMLQNAGFIYNNGTAALKEKIFSQFKVEAVLDFVSIRGLFKGADTKAVAVLIKREPPDPKHLIRHLTFRRTRATSGRMFFELDYYDYNNVPQREAAANIWLWRAGLLGGGRIFSLAQRLSEFQTLNDYLLSKGWKIGEGYISGKKNKTKKASFLTGKKLFPTTAFSENGIDRSKFEIVTEELFDTPYTEKNFKRPLFLIHKHEDLLCAYWDECDLAYKSEIVGVFCDLGSPLELQQFAHDFYHHKKCLQSALQLFATRLYINKATSVYKIDIANLPWPKDGKWNLSSWENELVEDITRYIPEYVRLGQDSYLLQQRAEKNHMEAFRNTFLRLMRTSFPDMQACGEGHDQGLAYQAFSFSKAEGFSWENSNWAKGVRSMIFKDQGGAASFMSVRVLRYYNDDFIVLIKPDVLRYWIRSVAIRDVDDVIADVLEGGNDA